VLVFEVDKRRGREELTIDLHRSRRCDLFLVLDLVIVHLLDVDDTVVIQPRLDLDKVLLVRGDVLDGKTANERLDLHEQYMNP
jgi:hypothetical protein